AYVGTHLPPDLRLAGVVDFYGPNDMILQIQKHAPPDLSKPHNPGAMEFFSVKEMNQSALDRLRDLSPINAIHSGMPPFLFIQGTADEQVPYQESPKMCQAMRKAGAVCEVITVEGGHHGMGSWEKHPEMAHWKPEMIAWLKKTLR
ncbi:MAG: alpha/beta hydrolase family protein, partial [Bryobacteraceae bacterium]